jgi:hypothetical protein
MRLVDGLRVPGGNNVWGSRVFFHGLFVRFLGQNSIPENSVSDYNPIVYGFSGSIVFVVRDKCGVCVFVCVSVWVYHKECFPGVLSRH